MSFFPWKNILQTSFLTNIQFANALSKRRKRHLKNMFSKDNFLFIEKKKRFTLFFKHIIKIIQPFKITFLEYMRGKIFIEFGFKLLLCSLFINFPNINWKIEDIFVASMWLLFYKCVQLYIKKKNMLSFRKRIEKKKRRKTFFLLCYV